MKDWRTNETNDSISLDVFMQSNLEMNSAKTHL
jgi:hypothetical protein